MKPCRRCSGCANSSHHWIDNTEAESPAEHSHVCKHCPALGHFCGQCQGEGVDLDDDETECPICKGEGVLLYDPANN